MMLLLLILLPIACALLSLLFTRKLQAILETLAMLSAGAQLVLAGLIAGQVASHGSYTYSSYFSVNAFEVLFLLIVAFVGAMATFYSVAYLRQEQKKEIIGFRRIKQYYILLNFFLGAMLLAIATTNPIIMWIGIEATTLSTAFLISFYNKPTATEAAWKYLIINSIGLLLGFFGTLLFFSAVSGEAHTLITWSSLAQQAASLNPALAKIAFVLILIGYGTKVGLVPMHTWLPDAHSKAPSPISGLLSGVLLNVALLAILRFKSLTEISVGTSFTSTLLIVFGLISIVVPALILLKQYNYKRMLAYSSIKHMGIVALGFGIGGLAIGAAILHMIYHSLVKTSLFLLSGNLYAHFGSTKIAKVRNALKHIPLTAILYFIALLAIVGVPPAGLFITEFYIMAAALAVHPLIAVLVLIALALAFIAFLTVANAMILHHDQDLTEHPCAKESGWLLVPPFALLAVFFWLSWAQPAILQGLISSAVTLLS